MHLSVYLLFSTSSFDTLLSTTNSSIPYLHLVFIIPSLETEIKEGVVCAVRDICAGNDKPEEAKAMLRKLSGREHSVITGVTLRMDNRAQTFSAHSVVRFTDLTEDQINYYVENYHPLDKAGAYGIQEWIGYVGIERIEGSFFNVMGLPIQRLCREIEAFIEELPSCCCY